MHINLDSYRVFYYVAQYRSFTKAAEILYSNQPNVTRTIKNLERALDCTLFSRTSRSVRLTPEGEELFSHIAPAIQQIKDGEEVLGNQTRVKVVKNKVAPPFRKAEFEILFGQGISKIGEIVDLGVDYGIIRKAGSWFSYGEQKIGQGRDAVKEALRNDAALREEIELRVRDAMNEAKEQR